MHRKLVWELEGKYCSGWRPMIKGLCGYGDESSTSAKGKEFLDHVNGC
jgi:hypothetical protein